MKRLFEIDWPDNYGPDFLETEEIQDLLSEISDEFNVTDVTPEKKTAPPKGGHDF